jgi:hypothetical protein
MPDGLGEYLLSLIEIAAGIEHAIALSAVLGPLLDFVVIAVVRNQRLSGSSVSSSGNLFMSARLAVQGLSHGLGLSRVRLPEEAIQN